MIFCQSTRHRDVLCNRRREKEAKLQAEEEEKKRKADERTRRVEAGEDPVEVDREIYGIIPESELAAAAEGEEGAVNTGTGEYKSRNNIGKL